MKKKAKAIKPNKPFIRRWIKALRGGKYEQTTGQLVWTSPDKERSYCCLGVACDLLGYKQEKNDYLSVPGHPSQQESSTPEHPYFFEHTGVNDAVVGELANMNDRGKSFEDIARALEQGYLQSRINGPLKTQIKTCSPADVD